MNDAIKRRIEEVCRERGSTVRDIALKSRMSSSAIYDLLKEGTKCSKAITAKRFCEDTGMTLSEFFDRAYFNEVEDE